MHSIFNRTNGPIVCNKENTNVKKHSIIQENNWYISFYSLHTNLPYISQFNLICSYELYADSFNMK